jgi:hypothetical protein
VPGAGGRRNLGESGRPWAHILRDREHGVFVGVDHAPHVYEQPSVREDVGLPKSNSHHVTKKTFLVSE